MHRELTEFETELLGHLTNPNPIPKYALWSKVQYTEGKNTHKGVICGFYFCRPAIAFAQDCYPGWNYYLEIENNDTKSVHETDIIGAIAP